MSKWLCHLHHTVKRSRDARELGIVVGRGKGESDSDRACDKPSVPPVTVLILPAWVPARRSLGVGALRPRAQTQFACPILRR